jgi:hypothetical protein
MVEFSFIVKKGGIMRKFILLVCFSIIFLLLNCEPPEEDETNPDLRIVNSFTNYKITGVGLTGQGFTEPGEYLLPGERTEYEKVYSCTAMILVYSWMNINNPSDSGDFSIITAEGQYPALEEHETYTLTYSGDKEDPTIEITQP